MIASLGHTDRMAICHSGLPIPREGESVDLALTNTTMRFVDATAAGDAFNGALVFSRPGTFHRKNLTTKNY